MFAAWTLIIAGWNAYKTYIPIYSPYISHIFHGWVPIPPPHCRGFPNVNWASSAAHTAAARR